MHTYIPLGIGVRDDAVLICLDECIELEFAVERDDVLFDIIDHRLGVEILGNTSAHSANRFKGVFKGFDWRGVILRRERVM